MDREHKANRQAVKDIYLIRWCATTRSGCAAISRGKQIHLFLSWCHHEH
jgi:hypothetical protein